MNKNKKTNVEIADDMIEDLMNHLYQKMTLIEMDDLDDCNFYLLVNMIDCVKLSKSSVNK